MNYWLIKTEPDVFAMADFKKQSNQTAMWEGVRNYQARNFIRDQMQKGDLCFVYHSSTEIPGVAGVAEIVKAGYPDPSAFDKKSDYYDDKPLKKDEPPRWYTFDVKAQGKFDEIISLQSLRNNPKVKSMLVLKQGMRLSIQPVTKAEWDQVMRMGTLSKKI